MVQNYCYVYFNLLPPDMYVYNISFKSNNFILTDIPLKSLSDGSCLFSSASIAMTGITVL